MGRIGYILLDGTFLNILEKGYKCHCQYENSSIRYLTNLNQWIRVNDGTNVEYEVLAELPIKGITEEQYKSLFEFIDYLRAIGRKKICVGCEEHSRGTSFTDKSLWHIDFNLETDSNQYIDYVIRNEYKMRETYGQFTMYEYTEEDN